MDALAAPAALVPPQEPRARPGRAPVGGFLGGVLVSQIANSALHLAQPLLIIELSGGSFGLAAFFSSFDTAIHMCGTFLGGWPADRLGARRLLILSTFLRGASLALIPLAWATGRLTLAFAMTAYTLDALVRGFVDTAVHALPLELGEHDRAELDRLNSRYEFVFDLGGVAGPMLLGAAMLGLKGAAPHLLVPAGFAAGALVFAAIPKLARAPRARQESGGTLKGLRLVWADPRLLAASLGLASLNIYPLRKLMSAFFAKAILSQPPAAAWVGAAFGLGGALGSLFYAWRGGRGTGAGWVAAGGAGVLILAAGWIPASLWPMMAAAFVFALANVGARLAVTSRLQESTPLEVAGGVTAVARFGQNMVSVILKALVGAAFAFGGGPRLAFAVVSGGLVLVALGQFTLARRLSLRLK